MRGMEERLAQSEEYLYCSPRSWNRHGQYLDDHRRQSIRKWASNRVEQSLEGGRCWSVHDFHSDTSLLNTKIETMLPHLIPER